MRWPPTSSAFANAIATLARQRFVTEGFLEPAAFLFATREPYQRQRLDPTLLELVLLGPPHSFARQLRQIAQLVHATMLAQAYEVKMVGELREQPSLGFEVVGDTSRARECLVVFVESESEREPRAWLAPIRETSPRSVGAFVEVDVPRVRGWLTDILSDGP